MQFQSFEKHVWKIMETKRQPIAGKKVMIRMYRGTLVSDSVNISVYFNKLANDF